VLDELEKVKARRKLVLTGTPLQNHVTELWAILNFLEPRKFDDLDAFLEAFGSLSTGGGTVGQVRSLTRLLKPHLLRREKADVETLHPMQETLLHVEITNMQKICYRAVLEHNRGLLVRSLDVLGSSARGAAQLTNLGGSFANVSMMLRHCCNHPWLIDEVKEGAMAHLEAETSVRPPRTEREESNPLYWHRQLTEMQQADTERYIDRLVRTSGKMVLLDKLLPKLQREGHRVLLFSQFTKLLDLVEDLVEARGWGYERLDGNVTGVTRQQAIDRFSDPSSSSFLFLLSTRAGGVGINLIAADTVIMFDSDWNPQNDVQAMARCHRIGQTKVVQVYKLCTKDTYETVMLQAANHKLGLEHAVIKQGGFEVAGSSGDKSAEPNWKEAARQKASTIERLLRAGAHMLTNTEHDQRIQAFDQSSIEDILTHYGETRLVGGDAPGGASGGADGATGSSSFALASFVSDESGTSIELDDPNFWSGTMIEPQHSWSHLLAHQP
jgi:SNF2 family DNA or RNA helicase